MAGKLKLPQEYLDRVEQTAAMFGFGEEYLGDDIRRLLTSKEFIDQKNAMNSYFGEPPVEYEVEP